jgi:hypothetical protein
MSDAAPFESQEEHNDTGNHSQGAQPVHGFESLHEWRLWRVDIEAEQYDDEGQAIERQIDPETPSAEISM